MNKSKILILIMLICFFSSFFIIIPVSADTGLVLLSSFDTVATGLDVNQTNRPAEYFTFMNVGADANDFETSSDQSISSPNSIKCFSDNGLGYLNLTTSFDFIYQINISVYFAQLGVDYITFYDSDDNARIKIRLDGVNSDIDWQDDGGYESIYDNCGILWYTLLITYNTSISTNWFNIQLIRRDTGATIANVDYASLYGGDWSNFSYIYVQSANNAGAYVYIDDIIIDLTPSDFELDADLGSRCSNPIGGYFQVFDIDAEGCSIDNWCFLNHFVDFGWSIQDIIDDCIDCPWTMIPARYVEHETEANYDERIRHVLLPISIDQINEVSDNPNDYSLMINDEFIGSANYIVEYATDYALVWENVNKNVSGKIVFSFACNQHTVGFSKDWYWYGLAGFLGGWGDTRVHNNIAKFYDGVISGNYMGNWKLSVCWYYDNSSIYNETEPWKIPIIEDYDDHFGMGDEGYGYIEFYKWDSPCYYRMDQREIPSIVYNLTGYGAGNGTKTYYYAIYRIRDNEQTNEIVYNDFIEVANRDYRRDIFTTEDFSFPQSGRYYIVCYNTSSPIDLEEFVHQSLTVQVCPSIRGGGGGTGIFFDIPAEYKVIIGVGVTIMFTIIPLVIAMQMAKYKISLNIPGLVYFSFFMLGIITSVILGFFDIWVLFIILFAIILWLAISYYSKQSESNVNQEE